MNYTLWHLQQRVNKLIEQQGEDAHCAAWIYTKEDCFLTDDNGEQEYPCDEHPELAERIFNDIGNNDYIYQVIQESVDEATEEQFNELHQLVTQEFLDRVKSGEATTQDLKAACDWLKSNDISGVAYDGSPLSKLASVLPEIDPDLVKAKLYGKIQRG